MSSLNNIESNQSTHVDEKRTANLAKAFAKFAAVDPEINEIFSKGVKGITGFIDDADFDEESKNQIKNELVREMLEGIAQLNKKYNIAEDELIKSVTSESEEEKMLRKNLELID